MPKNAFWYLLALDDDLSAMNAAVLIAKRLASAFWRCMCPLALDVDFLALSPQNLQSLARPCYSLGNSRRQACQEDRSASTWHPVNNFLALGITHQI